MENWTINLTTAQREVFINCLGNCLGVFCVLILVLAIIKMIYENSPKLRGLIIFITLSFMFIDLSPMFFVLWVLGVFG